MIEALVLLKNPNGTYGFVGKVPSQLAFEGHPTQKQLEAARQCGGRFLPKARVFENVEDAVAAASAIGVEIDQICE